MGVEANGETEADSVRFCTSPVWRLAGALAVAGAPVATGIIVANASRFGGVEGVTPELVVATLLYITPGFVVMLWGLRRLTERVELRADGLFHSVLGMARLIRYEEVVGMNDRESLAIPPGGPGRFATVCDGRGRRIRFPDYLEGFGGLLAQLKSRVGEGASVRCPPSISRRIAAVLALVLLGLAVVVLVRDCG